MGRGAQAFAAALQKQEFERAQSSQIVSPIDPQAVASTPGPYSRIWGDSMTNLLDKGIASSTLYWDRLSNAPEPSGSAEYRGVTGFVKEGWNAAVGTAEFGMRAFGSTDFSGAKASIYPSERGGALMFDVVTGAMIVKSGIEMFGANTSVDLAAQAGGTGSLRFPRTDGLATHSTMADLRATGALPGEQGVIITDRTVRFGDVYELGTLGGRQVEFSLVTEYSEGSLVKKLYSGDAWTSPVPRDSRLLGHVHPNENAFQLWPSTQDMNMVNARYFRDLMVNPNAAPAPTRIFWGPGNTDNTIFYPGFGKNPLSGKGG